jgi:hypothetical protein
METRNFTFCFLSFSLFITSLIFSSYKSEAKNKGDDPKIDKINTVLILGNSIVCHSPKPEIGWYNDWGMAASVRDSDFVHLLIRDIHQKNQYVEIKFKNIADFERSYDTFPLLNLDSLKNPDILILKIGANVDKKKAIENNFMFYYDKLVKYISPENKSIKVIVNEFYPSELNGLMKKYAIGNNYPFVTIDDLSEDSTNMAIGKFTNIGVSRHPSDKGMRLIEQQIWTKIKGYFE